MNRDEFLLMVDDHLLKGGFIKNDNEYNKSIQHQEPPQQIIINGQRMVQPGAIYNIDFKLTLCGEGNIDDNIYYELIEMNIIKDNEYIYNASQSFYYDEFELFTKYCNKLFNI